MIPSHGRVLSLFRQCIKELKLLEEMKTPAFEHYSWQKSPAYQCLKDSIHNNSCSMTVLELYADLLKAGRRAQDLIAMYRGVGERSVEETARIVGLKLPKLYQDKSDT